MKASGYVKATKVFTRDAATQVGTISTSNFNNEVFIYSPDYDIGRFVSVASQDYLGSGTVTFEGDLSDIEDNMEGDPTACRQTTPGRSSVPLETLRSHGSEANRDLHAHA